MNENEILMDLINIFKTTNKSEVKKDLFDWIENNYFRFTHNEELKSLIDTIIIKIKEEIRVLKEESTIKFIKKKNEALISSITLLIEQSENFEEFIRNSKNYNVNILYFPQKKQKKIYGLSLNCLDTKVEADLEIYFNKQNNILEFAIDINDNFLKIYEYEVIKNIKVNKNFFTKKSD